MRYVTRSDTLPGPLGEARAASAAGGGTALSTTVALIVLPDGTTHLQLLPRNFAGAVVAKVALNPYLAVLLTADALATVTDASVAAQDGLAATVVTLSAQPTLALGGAVYVGARVPFRGLDVTMSASVNANASVASVYFWDGTAWTLLTNGAHGYVDGTSNAGATIGKSGQIIWPTLPASWARASLRAIFEALGSVFPPGMSLDPQLADGPRYWVRLSVSATLSAAVTATAILPLARSTAYAELPSSLGLEARVAKGHGGIACVEALTDAGTANLIVNVYTDPAGSF